MHSIVQMAAEMHSRQIIDEVKILCAVVITVGATTAAGSSCSLSSFSAPAGVELAAGTAVVTATETAAGITAAMAAAAAAVTAAAEAVHGEAGHVPASHML